MRLGKQSPDIRRKQTDPKMFFGIFQLGGLSATLTGVPNISVSFLDFWPLYLVKGIATIDWCLQGDGDDEDDTEKTTSAEHILRDFCHEIRCALMDRDRGLRVTWQQKLLSSQS